MEVCIGQYASFADDDCLLDGMLQFADIAIPRMHLQLASGGIREYHLTFVVLLGEALDKQFGQWNNVFFPFPQRRNFHMDGIDTIKQVFAELALRHHFVQIAIGGTNQANVDGNGFVASHTHHGTALKHGEQLGLQPIRQIAYFVQEQGSSLRHFELARTIGMRIGKSAFLMSEQFAFEKSLRYGSHVYRHHILPIAVGQGMNLACQHFLTRTVLTGNQYIGIRLGHFLHNRTEFEHGLAGSPIHGRRGAFFLLLPALIRTVACIQQGLGEFGVVPRLHHKVGSSLLDSPYRQIDIGIRCKKYHRKGRIRPFYFVQPIKTFVAGVECIGKVHVEQHHIGIFLTDGR